MTTSTAKSSPASLRTHVRRTLLDEAAFEDNPMSEQGLAERFNVSRTPIRDVLAELERDGVVVRRRGKGVHLTRPSAKEIADLYEFRAAMESFAAGLVCERATDKQIASLEPIAHRFSRARHKEHPRTMDEANVAFHQRLIELADNPPLQRSMERLDVLVRSFKMAHGVERRLGRVLPPTDYPHESIVAKLQQRDTDAARHAIEQHILQAKRNLFQQALGESMA